MSAVQILWINLVTSVTLGLVLAFEPAEPGVMRRPPRARGAPLLSKFLLWRVFLVSLLFVGAALACAIALFIGLPTLRLRGAFFAMCTVAFPLITYAVLCNVGLEEVTIPYSGHSPMSLHFTDTRYYVGLSLVLLAVILGIVRWIERSRFGFSLKALKQNETAAEGMGVDTYRTKMAAFVLSAGLGFAAGMGYQRSRQ